jgi:hypothetical protein
MAEIAHVALNREQRAAMIGRNGSMQVRQLPGAWLPDNVATRNKVHHSLYAFYWVAPGGYFQFSTSVLTSALFLLPFVPRSCPQHCVGPGYNSSGCYESYDVTRLSRLPKNWSRLRKVTGQMVPMLPGLVGAPLCNACYNTILKHVAAIKPPEVPATGDLLCTRNVVFFRNHF